jgi:urease accessory protein
MTFETRFAGIARKCLVGFGVLLAATLPAVAHPGHGPMTGFLTGAYHPLSGADHLLAMVAVGLWAGLCDGPRQWVWPAAFVSSMVAGGALGMSGLVTASVEPAILLSVLVLGLAIALGVRAPLAVGGGLIALFGFAHGFAHGTEMPHSASGLDFAFGFTLTTAVLHSAGVTAAVGMRRMHLDNITRLAGVGIAMAGVGLMLGV